MNVPLKELEQIGEHVGFEVTDSNAFEFLHITQKAGFYRMYPKPNARRKAVPAQKPEIKPGGTVGKWIDLDMVMTKRGPKYTPHKNWEEVSRKNLRTNIQMYQTKIESLLQQLKDRGIYVPSDL